METLPLERQIQSVQRNITFLKKEQLELLRDLHLEILRLQKHCAVLTRDLKTKQLELSQQGSIEEEMEEKCRIMEIRLGEKEKTNSELRKELWHRETLVVALRSNLKDKERRFLEELKRRSHRVTILNTELQKQTEAAAYLSFQLHSTKQKLHSSRQTTRPLDRPPDKACPVQLAPECKPKKRSHKSHPRRHAPECSFSKGLVRDAAQRERLSSCEETDPMPDPSLFLFPKRHVPPHRQRSESKPQAVRHQQGFDQSDRATAVGRAFLRPAMLAEEQGARPSVKAKLPKSERENRRLFTRKDSRDSE